MSLFRQRGANDSLIFYYYFFTQVHDFFTIAAGIEPTTTQPNATTLVVLPMPPTQTSSWLELKITKTAGGKFEPRKNKREREKKYANQTLPPSLSLSQHIYAN